MLQPERIYLEYIYYTIAFSSITTDIASILSAVNALNDLSVADIIAGITEGDLDLQQMLRIMYSGLAGLLSGAQTSEIKFRDYADSKDRITATVDALGNRTAISVDGD